MANKLLDSATAALDSMRHTGGSMRMSRPTPRSGGGGAPAAIHVHVPEQKPPVIEFKPNILVQPAKPEKLVVPPTKVENAITVLPAELQQTLEIHPSEVILERGKPVTWDFDIVYSNGRPKRITATPRQ